MVLASEIKLLRIPFSFFLSPLYFFSLSQQPRIDPLKAALVFFLLHFLVYPASNGYNSFMDRDTKSIGGLEYPPLPTRKLYHLTIVLDILAVLLSALVHPLLPVFMLFYIGASKAYSYRGIRLKKYPITGYLTVIIFQGALTFALVYFGSGKIQTLLSIPWQGMVISALLIGGFYPLTQVYQHQQDLDDGVRSISYLLGYRGTFLFCGLMYAVAWSFMAQFFISLHEVNKLLMISIFFLPVIVYFLWWFAKLKKDTGVADFRHTMFMIWLAAICTNAAFLTLLIWNCLE
jgi:1,4-dihydroxy-2-naphthoate octaprenyltransferase